MAFPRSTDEDLGAWWPLEVEENCMGLNLVGEEGIEQHFKEFCQMNQYQLIVLVQHHFFGCRLKMQVKFHL